RAVAGLGYTPGCVGREVVAAAAVELRDSAVEAERALLDQVEERYAEAAVALRDRDDQAQVRLDHPPLGGDVAALDRLREGDLLGRGQQLVAPDVSEEELQAVGRADQHLRLRLEGLLLGLGSLAVCLLGGLADLEAGRLELTLGLLGVLLAEVVLQR